MRSEHELLLQKITAFNLDDAAANFSFTNRLARENGWNTAYAEAVIQEYKRFIFLCCVVKSGITPSDQVDQVWHLHLTYTQSYWVDFCSNTLNKEIHHNPTKGGTIEGEKFIDYYARTKQLYREYFKADPPKTIWPASEVRFTKTNFRRVDLNKYRLLPRVSLNTGTCFVLTVVLLSPLFIQSSPTSGMVVLVVFLVLFLFVALWRHFKKNDDGSGCSHSSDNNDSGDSGESGCACGGCSG